jgi:hypothetical protein
MSMIMVLKKSLPNAVSSHSRSTIPFGFARRVGGSGFGDEDEASISLEKAWHGLHFLLTGEPWGGDGPRAFLLCGGTEQGEDSGYGPARQFDAEEVQEIARELAGLTADELWSGFDPEAMAEADLYGADWEGEAEEDLREEFLEYFEILKAFVAETAKQGQSFEIEMT